MINNNSNNNNNNNILIIIVIIIIMRTMRMTMRSSPRPRKYWVDVHRGIVSFHEEREPL